MSALVRFIPSLVVAVAGAGLQLAGYTDRWWGNALLVVAVALAVFGIASLWLQQYIELRAARASLRYKLPENPQAIAQFRQQNEKLAKRLTRVERERDSLRTRLSDPTAKKRHAEEILRSRCLKLAQEVFVFAKARGHKDEQETVSRFNQRHKSKVTELRDELDKQGWLTPQERATLTFRADDHPDKIEEMVDTLRSIGMGH